MEKSLDRKLAALARNPDAKEFILADAKDADMAFGIGAPGQSPESQVGEAQFRTLADYRSAIREIVRQELVDIMLMSASSNELLTIRERLFDGSPVTPAARANDTSDIWVVRGGRYLDEPSLPFRSAEIDHIQCGYLDCAAAQRNLGANLGLYSVTFNNSLEHDHATLTAFHEFRAEAERKGFQYFLEVFDPNAPGGRAPEDIGRYVNDMIARCLAGLVGPARPRFLKIVYHGPHVLEELRRYDPTLVIGILGGSAGTTYDAFKLLSEARKYGARVALYGRKINAAENQFAFLRFLRLIVDGVISPEEAVRAYHGVLQGLGISPRRSLADDLILQTGVMSYGGSGKTTSLPAAPNPHLGTQPATLTSPESPKVRACRKGEPASSISDVCAGKAMSSGATQVQMSPVFSRMSAADRLDYHRNRIARILGENP